MMSLTEVWLVEGKEKLPVCLYFLRSMLLHHHRTHEPEHDLACLIFIFPGKGIRRKGTADLPPQCNTL